MLQKNEKGIFMDDYVVVCSFLQRLQNNNKINILFQLSEVVNSLSEHGQLPLQLALYSKNLQISQTLVKNGCANVNAYDANVSETVEISICKLYN